MPIPSLPECVLTAPAFEPSPNSAWSFKRRIEGLEEPILSGFLHTTRDRESANAVVATKIPAKGSLQFVAGSTFPLAARVCLTGRFQSNEEKLTVPHLLNGKLPHEGEHGI